MNQKNKQIPDYGTKHIITLGPKASKRLKKIIKDSRKQFPVNQPESSFVKTTEDKSGQKRICKEHDVENCGSCWFDDKDFLFLPKDKEESEHDVSCGIRYRQDRKCDCPLEDKEKSWEKELDDRFVGIETHFSDWLTENNGKIIKSFIRSLLQDREKELIKEIEGMKMEISKGIECIKCGDIYDCTCEGYNEALDDVLSLIRKEKI